jgi:hypothetical protein
MSFFGKPASTFPGHGPNLPRLVLWDWDHDDDLSFVDARDTAVAYLAATLTLRGEAVAYTPRHNPVRVRADAVRVAVVHVENDRAAPPVLSDTQRDHLVERLASIAEEVPHRVLQVDYEAAASQRAFLIDAMAALRARLAEAPVSMTALSSWCFNEGWTGALAADEVVPMLFRMGYDGRRLRARLADGGDFRRGECRTSIGVALDELPATLPPGRRVYVFSPRRWTPQAYATVRTRIRS